MQSMHYLFHSLAVSDDAVNNPNPSDVKQLERLSDLWPSSDSRFILVNSGFGLLTIALYISSSLLWSNAITPQSPLRVISAISIELKRLNSTWIIQF